MPAILEQSIRIATRRTPLSEVTKPLHEFTVPFYEKIYNGIEKAKSDSPDKSRINLVRKARPIIQTLGNTDFVLDLGSGPQIFERQYFQANQLPHQRPRPKFVSVDRAWIDADKLLMKNSKKVTHTQASGDSLPFGNEIFGLVVSNMALDFMPDSAIIEMRRVMKTGAHALIRLHHPSIFYEDPQAILDSHKIPHGEKAPVVFWEELRRRGILTNHMQEVHRRFAVAGFKFKELKLASDHKDSWWELDLVKTPVEKVFSKKTGRLVSKIIATRKAHGKGMDKETVRQLAHQFQKSDINPRDPSNPNKSITFTTLISKIDAGVI